MYRAKLRQKVIPDTLRVYQFYNRTEHLQLELNNKLISNKFTIQLPVKIGETQEQ